MVPHTVAATSATTATNQTANQIQLMGIPTDCAARWSSTARSGLVAGFCMTCPDNGETIEMAMSIVAGRRSRPGQPARSSVPKPSVNQP